MDINLSAAWHVSVKVTVYEFWLQFESEAAPLSFDEFVTSYQMMESETQSHFSRKTPVPKRCPDLECVWVSHANCI